jgi:hypothetical protein
MYRSAQSTPIRVLRLRVKDRHAAWLSSLAREVNTVFNYCNELSIKVFERGTGLVQANGQIVVGDVNASALARTRQAKSVLDAGCSMCGAIHDRDVSAAQNILAAGHRRLAEGISGL